MKISISYLHADAILVSLELGVNRSEQVGKPAHRQECTDVKCGSNTRLVISNAKRYFNAKHA